MWLQINELELNAASFKFTFFSCVFKPTLLPPFTFVRPFRHLRQLPKQFNFSCLKRLTKVNRGSRKDEQLKLFQFKLYLDGNAANLVVRGFVLGGVSAGGIGYGQGS